MNLWVIIWKYNYRNYWNSSDVITNIKLAKNLLIKRKKEYDGAKYKLCKLEEVKDGNSEV